MQRLVLLFLITSSLAGHTQNHKQDLPLFNGENLKGWEYFLVDENLKMEEVWSVQDGILICKGEPLGYLVTQNEYTNYKLVVEWRWAPGTPAGNSGVLMRISGEPKGLPKCFEAQLQHGNVGDIYGFHGNKVAGDSERFIERESDFVGKMTGVKKIQDAEYDAGEWNRYEIFLLKGNLTVYVNGQKVNEADGLEQIAGKIGFQSEGGEIQFRRISILPLDQTHGHSHMHSRELHEHASHNEWPQFHGPDRNNRSKEKDLLDSWPAEGPELLWKASGLGEGYSSVSVAEGVICTAGNVGDHTLIFAHDLEGNLIWQQENGKAWQDSYPGSRGTPTIHESKVYHQSPVGNLVCLNLKDGSVIWQTNVLDLVNSENSKWALAESLLIDGNHVISTPGGPDASMIVLNKNKGNLGWTAASIGDLAGYSSPILIEFGGKRILVNLTAKNLIGVDADTGKLLWNVKHESYADENVMIPIHHGGYLFVSTLKAGSVKWQLVEESGRIGIKEIWRSEAMDNHHGDVALIEGYLYGTSTFYNRDQWVCLNWETGETEYITEGTGKSALTFADNKLYTVSTKGLVGLVKPYPEEFEVISTFQLPKGGVGPNWAHPVICDGKLYIRHGEFLYVYKVK